MMTTLQDELLLQICVIYILLFQTFLSKHNSKACPLKTIPTKVESFSAN
jgi:hypothetical protein